MTGQVDPLTLRPTQVVARLLELARTTGRPAQEVYTLHVLERALDRLSRTTYVSEFILKGGILLAAHRLRRPTSDIDMQAVAFPLDETHMRQVMTAIAAVDVPDGMVFDVPAMTVEQIRDHDEYMGMRVSTPVKLDRITMKLKMDISTGDPISPAPESVRLPGLLGGHVDLLVGDHVRAAGRGRGGPRRTGGRRRSLHRPGVQRRGRTRRALGPDATAMGFLKPCGAWRPLAGGDARPLRSCPSVALLPASPT